MATVQNQTHPKEFINAASGAPGTGIFLVPDLGIEAAIGATIKITIPNLTYSECIQKGLYCIAFKWVSRILSSQATQCTTPGAPCVTWCDDDLCMCKEGHCE
jgi:hypothetical protein